MSTRKLHSIESKYTGIYFSPYIQDKTKEGSVENMYQESIYVVVFKRLIEKSGSVFIPLQTYTCFVKK